jgi:hypothetical protein
MDMIPVFHLQKSEGLLINVMVKGNSIRGYQSAPQDEKKFLQFLQTEVRRL